MSIKKGLGTKRLLTLVATVCLVTVVVPVAGHAAATHGLCFGRVATIVGTPGPDVIVGTRGKDVIRGLGGNDKIFGGGGSDHICGGRGNDTIHGDKTSPTHYGHVGNDSMAGGRGNDRLVGDGMGWWGIGDTFVGGRGDDYMTEGPMAVLAGTPRMAESIFNRVDYSHAPGPISVLITSPPPPTFGTTITVTGDGTDTIDAWAIQDFLASPYDDQIHVHGFMEAVSGMGGSDTLVYGKNAQGLDVSGDWPAPAATDGNDTMIFKNGATVDDAVKGYGGNDTFDGVVEPLMEGGRGGDTFINGASGLGGPGNDTFINSPFGTGGGGNDTMIASVGGSRFDGSNGSDTITGGPGPDNLVGGPGDDTIYGQDGISGNDTIDGGDGTDVCTFDQGDTVLNCP
jgi:Ca2+-binding RTX toxin-like protein